MESKKFRGTTVALITPFDLEGNIDEKKLRKLVDWQIANKIDTILACGTTGESATLSGDEHHEVISIIIDQVNSRVPVLCGTGSNSTRNAIEMTRKAEEAGGDCILSVAPYYNKPTQEGLYQHFKAIAESTKLPVILYNVPGRTGSNISAQTTLRLSKLDNIIGIKEASGNLSQIMEIIRNRPNSFLVLSGDDAITLPILALGGDGVISVLANETPKILHDMVHNAFHGNWNKAREFHYYLLPLMEANFIESNPIPVKTALSMMGFIEENFRLPLVPMSEENKKKLASILKSIDLIQ